MPDPAVIVPVYAILVANLEAPTASSFSIRFPPDKSIVDPSIGSLLPIIAPSLAIAPVILSKPLVFVPSNKSPTILPLLSIAPVIFPALLVFVPSNISPTI